MKKLNIGSGGVNKEGYDNLDLKPETNGIAPDIIADARNLPIKDNTYDIVHSWGFIEHIEPEDVPTILSEMYRVLKSGGIVEMGTEDFGYQVFKYLTDGISGWTHSAVFGPNYSHRSLFDERKLRKCMTDAEFKNIELLGEGTGILYMKGVKQ